MCTFAEFRERAENKVFPSSTGASGSSSYTVPFWDVANGGQTGQREGENRDIFIEHRTLTEVPNESGVQNVLGQNPGTFLRPVTHPVHEILSALPEL